MSGEYARQSPCFGPVEFGLAQGIGRPVDSIARSRCALVAPERFWTQASKISAQKKDQHAAGQCNDFQSITSGVMGGIRIAANKKSAAMRRILRGLE
jgi:hypothetical protein